MILGGLLGWFLLFPSLGTIQKYLGGWAVTIYVAAGLLGCFTAAARHEKVRAWVERTSSPRATLLSAIAIAGIALSIALLYPTIDSGEFSRALPRGLAGGGSDRDDALNLGAQALLDGRNPYGERTYLGNPISPLPGSLLLALPFALVGNVVWQNVFWFGAWLLLLARLFADTRAGLAVAVLGPAASPVMLQDLVTGGDLVANGVMVLAAAAITARVTVVRRRLWLLMTAAMFAGVAFATRGVLVLLLPLLAAFVHQRAGIRVALLYCLTLAATVAVVTLPFYFYDPAAFVPLATQNKFRFLTGAVPGADVLLPAVCAALAAAAPAVLRGAAWPWWLVAGGLVLTVPVALFQALSIALGSADLVNTSYALPGLVFGVPGVCLLLWRQDRSVSASYEARARP